MRFLHVSASMVARGAAVNVAHSHGIALFLTLTLDAI